MIGPLRQYHVAAWIALAALLPVRELRSQFSPAQADSAAIVHAAWEAATRDTRRAVVLWTPLPSDTARAIHISAEVSAALAQQRVPVTDQPPAGDDTVVYRITDWRADSSGTIVQFSSRWTEVLGQGTRRCRVTSGNSERFRVRRELGTWVADRLQPIVHGDGLCVKVRDE